MRRAARMSLTWVAGVLLAASVQAQELTPRAYWPAPKGTKLAVLGYSYSWGDVITDPSLPIFGVDSKLSRAQLAYLQTVSLAGRSANFLFELPYTWGSTVGEINGAPQRRELSGIGDVAVTLSVNFMGAPSMTPADFQNLRRNPHQILGASLKVLAPTGDYEQDRVLNVGGNRWAYRAELGYMIPLRPKWLLELEGSVWFFGDNDDFLGTTREQDSIVSAELHLVRRIRPGFWMALNLNYFYGGESTIDGVPLGDLQRNSRIGLDVLYSFRPPHAFKFGYSTGFVTESGDDYNSVLLAYNVLLGR